MEDIKVIHELNEKLNQRIMFIKDTNDQSSIDIVTSSNKYKSYYHAIYFKEYLNSYYLEDEVLQNIKPKINPLDSIIVANIIYYITKQYESIIFMETTGDNDIERYGVLTFPNEISSLQYEIVQSLESYFKKFKNILIQGNLISDGITVVDSEIKEIVDGNNFKKY